MLPFCRQRVIATLLGCIYGAFSPCIAELASPVQAQELSQDTKPVLAVSIASFDALLNNTQYLAETAGFPEATAFLRLGLGRYADYFDKTLPMGVMATIKAEAPKSGDIQMQGLIFLPIKELNGLLEELEDYIGKPSSPKNGNGIMRLDINEGIYLKQQGAWVYLADDPKSLQAVPNDPTPWLDGLDKQYLIAARFFVQNLPKELKDYAIEELKAGVLDGLSAPNALDNDTQTEMREESIKSLVMAIEQTDEMTLGFQTDSQAGRTRLDFTLSAVADSEFARQFKSMGNQSSRFNGFLMPDAAITFRLCGKMADQDQAQLQQMMQMVREQLKKDLADKGDDAERRNAAIDKLVEILQESTNGGLTDLAGACIVEPSRLAFGVGGHVKDGRLLEKQLKELVEIIKEDPRVPEIRFDVAEHQQVKFHHFAVPLPEAEENARKILGDSLQVVIGTGPDSCFLGFGKDAETLLRRAIDGSQSTPALESLPPASINIAIAPLLRLFANLEDGQWLKPFVAELEQRPGNDRIIITTRPIDNGAGYRLEIESDVLRVIGSALRKSRGNGGF